MLMSRLAHLDKTLMATEILMPALSPTMEEGKLVKWHVGEGDPVRAGDVIAEIETDKATMEVESVDDGHVGKILVAEGTEHVPVNQPIAVLLTDGEGLSTFPPRGEVAAQRTAGEATSKPNESVTPSALPTTDLGEALAGPQIAPREPQAEAEVPPGTEMVSMTVPGGTSASACGSRGAICGPANASPRSVVRRADGVTDSFGF